MKDKKDLIIEVLKRRTQNLITSELISPLFWEDFATELETLENQENKDCVTCPANQFYLSNTEKIMNEQESKMNYSKIRDLTDEEWLQRPKEEILQLYKNCYKMLTDKKVIEQEREDVTYKHNIGSTTQFNVQPKDGVKEQSAVEVLCDVYGCKDKDDLKKCFSQVDVSVDMIVEAIEQYHNRMIEEEIELMDKAIKNLHKAMVSAEKRGHDKAEQYHNSKRREELILFDKWSFSHHQDAESSEQLVEEYLSKP